MIKKFIIRGVSKEFTGIQKLKAQKVPKMERSGSEAAETQFYKIFGDKPQFAGFSGSKRFGATATGTELAAKDLAIQTSEKSFFKILTKGLKRQSETKFIKKVYDTANVQSVKVHQRTLQKFTGKSGISPFVHKPIPLKFIKSKRFKKGKFDQPYPQHYSKLESAAHFEKQRMSAWFKKPEVVSALKEGRTTEKNVWKAFWKEEKRQKREYARAMAEYPRKK
jgi:uncharacterized protein YprB with RNaseH-like and TPR domain